MSCGRKRLIIVFADVCRAASDSAAGELLQRAINKTIPFWCGLVYFVLMKIRTPDIYR